MAQLTEAGFLLKLPDSSYTKGATFWIAYSGGLDSQVLLDLALKTLPKSTLKAIHIHHGLHADADHWQEHCENVCAQADIELHTQWISPNKDKSSLEQEARFSRYAAFESLLRKGDYLLMAHHQDDQLETLLFRLARGSGIKGLCGIPSRRQLGDAILLRPLLEYSKDDLRAYAQEHKLSWIEDSSNVDTNFDRNFLRHEIVSRLKQRWPGIGSSVQRSATLHQETDQLLATLAQMDLGMDFTGLRPRLPLAKLKALDASRQRNALRYWFAALSQQYRMPAPGFDELRRLVTELIPAVEDAEPIVFWSDAGVEVQARRYRDTLHVLVDFSKQGPSARYPFKLSDQLQLPNNLGRVSLKASPEGIVIDPEDKLEIRFSNPEGSARPRGRRTRTFKKLYQDFGVPPWMRERIPLLYVNDELAAVGDLFLCAEKCPDDPENCVILAWERADIHCGY